MQPYIDQILEVIGAPTSNLVVATLLLAAVTLLVLILVVGLLILLLPGRSRGQESTAATTAAVAKGPRSRSGTGRRALARVSGRSWAAMAVLLVLAGVVAAYTATSTNSYCGDTCHVMTTSAESWRLSDHASIDCVRCHEGAAGLTAPRAGLDRLRHTLANSAGKSPAPTPVAAQRCTTCHEKDLTGSIEVTSGIRMSHQEPLAAGMTCGDCHEHTGHAAVPTSRGTRMSQCITCHNGGAASGECQTCHVGDPGRSPVFPRIYPQTQLPQPTCGTCHDEKSCDACHGIRMPHTVAFVEGDHARVAAFDRKEFCWRCHVETDCYGCHGEFDAGHGSGFKRWHQSFPRDALCATCHKHHEGPFCNRCH